MTGWVESYQQAIPATLTLISAMTAAIVSIIQAFKSKARNKALTAQVGAAADGLSLSQQVTQVSEHAANTSAKIAEVAVQTNGALTKLRADLSSTNERNVTLSVENTALRQQVSTLTDLLHARGQSRSTDRITIAEAEHQQTLDAANAAPIKVEITKLPKADLT